MWFVFLIRCNHLIFSSFLLPWVVQCQGLSFLLNSQFLYYRRRAVHKSRHFREQKFQLQSSSSFHTGNKCMLHFWQESSIENISGVMWWNPKEGTRGLVTFWSSLTYQRSHMKSAEMGCMLEPALTSIFFQGQNISLCIYFCSGAGFNGSENQKL